MTVNKNIRNEITNLLKRFQMLFKKYIHQKIHTARSFSMASFIFVVYFFGRHKCPSDLLGSELKPMTGLQLLRTLLAAIRKVPSPPEGITISAHSISSSCKQSL